MAGGHLGGDLAPIGGEQGPGEIDGLLPDSATLYDLRAEISDFVLPDSEALWTTEMMKRHCRTWTSVSGLFPEIFPFPGISNVF